MERAGRATHVNKTSTQIIRQEKMAIMRPSQRYIIKRKKSSSEIPKCRWPSTYFFVLPIWFASFNYTHRLENKWTRPHIHKITGSRAIEFHIIRNQTVGEVEKDAHTHTHRENFCFFSLFVIVIIFLRPMGLRGGEVSTLGPLTCLFISAGALVFSINSAPASRLTTSGPEAKKPSLSLSLSFFF